MILMILQSVLLIVGNDQIEYFHSNSKDQNKPSNVDLFFIKVLLHSKWK